MRRRKDRPLPAVRLSAITVAAIAAAVACAAAVCVALFSSLYSDALLRDARVGAQQTAHQSALAAGDFLRRAKARVDRVSGMIDTAASAEALADVLSPVVRGDPDIYALMVYDTDGQLLACAGEDGMQQKTAVRRDLSFDRALFASADTFAVSAPHVQTLFENSYPWVVTIAARRESTLFGKTVYVAADLRFSSVARYINNVGVGLHGYCYVVDRSGTAVYHPQQRLIDLGLTEAPPFSGAPRVGVHTVGGTIYAADDTEDGDWRVVCVSLLDELYAQRRSQIVLCIAITLLCSALIALIVLRVYARIVTAPVHELTRQMRAFEHSADLAVCTGCRTGAAEIAAISDSFLHMAQQIRRLLEQVKAEQTELRKTELKALQAQIDPHFLYNTLDSIQWMCERGNTADAVKMVGALAKLFRISISRGRELITIGEELDHARSYLTIQSYRYRDRFTYRFTVDEGLTGCLINKITLQPLIENAIIHGIDQMVDEGVIEICVKNAPDGSGDILLTVSDNGVGMSRGQAESLLQKRRSDNSGIGMKNVNDRLRIYFGERYGLTIDSEPDEGTTVTVRIPRLTKEEAEDAH